MTMTPYAWEVITQVAGRRRLEPRLIIAKRKRNAYRVVMAIQEVARLLSERGYSYARIGQILNKDHTTVGYYLGSGKRASFCRPRWKTPHIAHLRCQGCSRCRIGDAPLPKLRAPGATCWPLLPKNRYLIPYVGADPGEYVWKRRPSNEDHRPQKARQADHAGQGR